MYSLNRFFCMLWHFEICKHSNSLFIHANTEKLVFGSQAAGWGRLAVFTKVVTPYQLSAASTRTVPDPQSLTLSDQFCSRGHGEVLVTIAEATVVKYRFTKQR